MPKNELTLKPNYEKLHKLFKDFETLQSENIKMLKRMKYYYKANKNLRFKIDTLKMSLRETNAQIVRSDRRIRIFNQLTELLHGCEQ